MQRKAYLTWMVVMVVCLASGTVAFVYFSMPLEQARDLTQWALPFSNLEFLTPAFFERLSAPARLGGALLVAVGLGCLIMPVKTRAWIEHLYISISKNSKDPHLM